MTHLTAVLEALRRAGLTANPKCRLGLEEADYLGHTVGGGCASPSLTRYKASRPGPALDEETGEDVSRSTWLLPPVHPCLCHYSSPLTRAHGKKPAQPGPVDPGDRGRLPGPGAQPL